MKLVFDPRAVEDLERIHDFIAADNPAAAQAVIDRILTSIERLGEFPTMGRAGEVEGTREWAVPRLSYLAVCQIDTALDIVKLLAIFHGAQDRSRQ